MAITTQFCFDAEPVIAWANRLRASGITLPVHIGVAGPAKLQTMLKFAMACGVGPSLRVLQRRAADLSKLMLPFEPTEMLAALARAQGGASGIRGRARAYVSARRHRGHHRLCRGQRGETPARAGMTLALLFDLDGTLVDSDHLHHAAFVAILAERGESLSLEDYRTHIMGKPNLEIMERYFPGQAGEHAADRRPQGGDVSRQHERVPGTGGGHRGAARLGRGDRRGFSGGDQCAARQCRGDAGGEWSGRRGSKPW